MRKKMWRRKHEEEVEEENNEEETDDKNELRGRGQGGENEETMRKRSRRTIRKRKFFPA